MGWWLSGDVESRACPALPTRPVSQPSPLGTDAGTPSLAGEQLLPFQAGFVGGPRSNQQGFPINRIERTPALQI